MVLRVSGPVTVTALTPTKHVAMQTGVISSQSQWGQQSCRQAPDSELVTAGAVWGQTLGEAGVSALLRLAGSAAPTGEPSPGGEGTCSTCVYRD